MRKYRKSIRSKSRKASRSEFRNTIGAVAAAKFSAQVQSNLRSKIESTDLKASTLLSLASQLGSSDPITPSINDDVPLDAPPKTDVSALKVNKKKTVVRATKKHSKVEPAGQSGAKR